MSESLDEPGTISPSLVPQQKEVSSHCTDPNDGSSDTIPPSSIPGDGSWDTIAPSPISQQTVDNTDAGDGPCDPVTESGPHETTDLSESGDRPSYTYTTTADPTESGDKSPDTTTADPTESGDKSSDSTPPSSIPEWTAGLTEVGDNSSDTTALSPILQQTSNLMEASHNSSDAIHSASVAQQTTDHMEACHGSPYAIPPSQQTAGLTETGHGSSDHNHHPSNPNKDKETTKELIAAISASHQKISASNNTTQYLFEDHPAYITFREFIYIVYMDEEQVLSDFNLRLGLESDDGVLGMLLEGSLIRPHKNKGFELSIRPFFRCFITPTVNISHIKSTVSTAIEFLKNTDTKFKYLDISDRLNLSYHVGNRTYTGYPRYGVGFQLSGLVPCPYYCCLLIIQAPHLGENDKVRYQALCYLACLQAKRRELGRTDLDVYGIVADGFRYLFILLTRDNKFEFSLRYNYMNSRASLRIIVEGIAHVIMKACEMMWLLPEGDCREDCVGTLRSDPVIWML